MKVNFGSLFLNTYNFNFLIGLMVSLPLLNYIPFYYPLISLFIMLTYYFMSNEKKRKFVAQMMALASGFMVYRDFGTLLDIEAGVTFLCLLQALKFLEIKKKQDAFNHYVILLFLISAPLLFDQNIFNTFYALTSLILILYGFIKAEDSRIQVKSLIRGNFKKSFGYVILALPVTLSLFLFFPRFEIGFRSFNQDSAVSGFSPEANPGQTDELVLSDQVAFRVFFEKDTKVPMQESYWVGAVLTDTDGYKWRKPVSRKIKNKVRYTYNRKDVLEYQVKSELMVNQYLFLLDKPVRAPMVSVSYNRLTDKTYKLNRIYTKKIRYQGSASLEAVQENELTNYQREIYLKIPKRRVSETVISLANQLKSDSPQKSVQNILDYFKNEEFFYTLKPGRTQSLDEFLKSKKGFCTHYASAFSILARVMGIPSRLVTGYQGGVRNDIGQFYTISQKDAHAWSEVYLDGKWRRIDPVGVIQPQRILLGGSDFFQLSQNGETQIARAAIQNYQNSLWRHISLHIDNLNNKWGNFMYSFNQEYQADLARKLNISLSTFYRMAMVLPVLILFVYFLFYLRKRRGSHQSLTQAEKEYRQVLKDLEKHGVFKDAQDGPRSMLAKIKVSNMDQNLKFKVMKVVKTYQSEFYL